MNKLLTIISWLGNTLVVFGVLFLLQELTLGKIEFINSLIVFNIVPFKYLLFTALSFLFVLKFIDFYIPDRK